MRLKEFIVFIVIYTIGYFAFFFIIGLVSSKKEDYKLDKKIKNMVNADYYKKFALFYGFQSNINDELLDKIYSIYSNLEVPCKISEFAKKIGLTPYEIVVIGLYLEYIGVCGKKIFSFEKDLITNPNNIDRNIMNKYTYYFNEKKRLDEINAKLGSNTYNDIFYMNTNNLMPGIRLINNQLYYVGDIYEEN